MHILIWLDDIFLLGSIVWLSKICNASMPSYFSLPKLHISFLEIGRKRRQCYDMPWWGTKHLWAIREYHSRSICEVCFISKVYKNSKLLRCENGKRWLCFRAVPLLNHSRRYVSHFTYPIGTRWSFGITLMLAHILNSYVYVYFILNLCSGRAKI